MANFHGISTLQVIKPASVNLMNYFAKEFIRLTISK